MELAQFRNINKLNRILTKLTLRLPFVVKAFWQTAHRKGLSPVCVRMWICSADDDEKFLRHTPHKCLEDVGGGG